MIYRRSLMNTMQLEVLIRTLFSPRKLWNAIQVWKMVRNFKFSSPPSDVLVASVLDEIVKERSKIMQERFEREVMPTLTEGQKQAMKQPVLTPENAKALEEVLKMLSSFGGADVKEEGEGEEE